MNSNKDSGEGDGGGNSGGGNPDPGGGGNPGHGKDEANIIIDNKHYKVRAGDWIVHDLKSEAGVDPAKVLAEIKPSGLLDLEDGARITVRDGMRFMSHARSGASS